LQIVGDAGPEVPEPAYCKAEGALPGSDGLLPVRFTSLPHGFDALLRDSGGRVGVNSPPSAARAPPSTDGDRLEAPGPLQ
jgi:hypothetical protein